MSAEERKRLKSREQNLVDLITDLESGSVHPEDLDEGLRAKLEELLIRKNG